MQRAAFYLEDGNHLEEHRAMSNTYVAAFSTRSYGCEARVTYLTGSQRSLYTPHVCTQQPGEYQTKQRQQTCIQHPNLKHHQAKCDALLYFCKRSGPS